MIPDHESVTAEAKAFVERFLPEGAGSAHALLFGLGEDKLPAWTPSLDSAQQCVGGFAKLIREAAALDVNSLILAISTEATELVIAYLTRTGPQSIAAPSLAALIRSRRPELVALVEQLGGLGNDSLKRLTTIAELLETPPETTGSPDRKSVV